MNKSFEITGNIIDILKKEIYLGQVTVADAQRLRAGRPTGPQLGPAPAPRPPEAVRDARHGREIRTCRVGAGLAEQLPTTAYLPAAPYFDGN